MVKKIKQFAALAMACTFAASGLFAIDYKQITVQSIFRRMFLVWLKEENPKSMMR